MAVVVSDSFTDTSTTALTSHVGETGATWTAHPMGATNLQISSAGRVFSSNSGSVQAYASGVPASAEYDVEAPFYVLTTGVYHFPALHGRMSTSVNTSYLIQWQGDHGEVSMYRVVADSYTQIGSYVVTITAATTRVLKLEIRDGAKKLFVDAVERISSADNAITAAGRAGVGQYSNVADTTGIHITSFTVTDLSVGGGDPEGSLLSGKLVRGGLLRGGVLTRARAA